MNNLAQWADDPPGEAQHGKPVSQASDRELNVLMLAMDLDMTMRGIKHPAPPYIPSNRNDEIGIVYPRWLLPVLSFLAGVGFTVFVLAVVLIPRLR